jgi:hypothetical protein
MAATNCAQARFLRAVELEFGLEFGHVFSPLLLHLGRVHAAVVACPGHGHGPGGR